MPFDERKYVAMMQENGYGDDDIVAGLRAEKAKRASPMVEPEGWHPPMLPPLNEAGRGDAERARQEMHGALDETASRPNALVRAARNVVNMPGDIANGIARTPGEVSNDPEGAFRQIGRGMVPGGLLDKAANYKTPGIFGVRDPLAALLEMAGYGPDRGDQTSAPNSRTAGALIGPANRLPGGALAASAVGGVAAGLEGGDPAEGALTGLGAGAALAGVRGAANVGKGALRSTRTQLGRNITAAEDAGATVGVLGTRGGRLGGGYLQKLAEAASGGLYKRPGGGAIESPQETVTTDVRSPEAKTGQTVQASSGRRGFGELSDAAGRKAKGVLEGKKTANEESYQAGKGPAIAKASWAAGEDVAALKDTVDNILGSKQVAGRVLDKDGAALFANFSDALGSAISERPRTGGPGRAAKAATLDPGEAAKVTVGPQSMPRQPEIDGPAVMSRAPGSGRPIEAPGFTMNEPAPDATAQTMQAPGASVKPGRSPEQMPAGLSPEEVAAVKRIAQDFAVQHQGTSVGTQAGQIARQAKAILAKYAPEYNELNESYHRRLTDVETSNDILLNREEANPHDNASMRQRAASRLAKYGENTEGAATLDAELEQLVSLNPELARDLQLIRAVRAQGEMSPLGVGNKGGVALSPGGRSYFGGDMISRAPMVAGAHGAYPAAKAASKVRPAAGGAVGAAARKKIEQENRR